MTLSPFPPLRRCDEAEVLHPTSTSPFPLSVPPSLTTPPHSLPSPSLPPHPHMSISSAPGRKMTCTAHTACVCLKGAAAATAAAVATSFAAPTIRDPHSPPKAAKKRRPERIPATDGPGSPFLGGEKLLFRDPFRCY